MDKNDKITVASVLDKAARCAQKNVPACSNFLDLHMQTLVEAQKKQFQCAFQFWGGYEGAERRLAVFLPDYMEQPNEDWLAAVRVTAKNAQHLTHRDYLGAVLGVGLKREQVGDVLLDAAGAYVLVKAEIADFLCQNLIKAGRENVSCTRLSVADIPNQKQEARQEITASAASLRLDKITAEAFKVSRTDAASAIAGGRVFVNHKEVLKPDFQLTEGDAITFRGKGKAELGSVLGVSKKGKQRILIKRY